MARGIHRAIGFGLLVAALLAQPPRAQEAAGSRLDERSVDEHLVVGPRVVGPAETVFDWERDRCARWHIPDTPARAWRGEDGAVRLATGAEESRALAGPDLDSVAPVCAVLYRGGHDDDPAAFDDRAWIAAVYPRGGGRVEALAHVEYHGHLRPDRCPGGVYAACWGNAIVALESEDGGRSFRRAAGGGLVASLPYRYDGGHGRRAGYFSPSNIIRRGDHLYVFVFAEAYRAQRRGVCLLRRPVDGAPGDWRGWDGATFSVRFVDPYREAVDDPAAHVCAPLPGLRSAIRSVARRDGVYLAATPAAPRDAEGRERPGIWWTVSEDLLAWSPPRPLLDAPLQWRRDCDATTAYAYPSLIDPDSRSDGFEDLDADFWLYLTEMPLDADCRIGPRRNLVRFPVSWPRG